MDKCLLDKLPLGQGQPVYIEEHWAQDDRDTVIEDIAKLGAELRQISKVARSHHEAADLKCLRGDITYALLRIQEALMPIFGAEALWTLARALKSFNEGYKGNRHWLVTFNKDEPHLPRNAPYRNVRKALAAAVLEYFDAFQTELGMNQGTIAARIAEAMNSGGFRVRPERNMPLSSRTVQDWRNLYASGKRPGRTKRSRYVIQAFEYFVQKLGDGRGDKTALLYFNEALADVTMHCRHHGEVFSRDRAITTRKT